MTFPNKALSGSALFLGLSLLFSCSNSRQNFFREADFNADWVFHMGDMENGADPGLDDAEWNPVHLPHDWSIIDYEIQDSIHQGPFRKDLPGGSDVGYLRDGIAWYRKHFVSPENLGEKMVILDFDGVQTQMEVWVNGEFIGEHVHGYTPFKFDISLALKGAGEPNVIAVKTINKGENSRWYAGAGIYRPLHLSILNPVSVAPWGVYITSSNVSAESAEIKVQVEINCPTEDGIVLECGAELISPSGEILELQATEQFIEGDNSVVLNLKGEISRPQLWGPDHPNLYRAVIKLFREGNETDRYESTFGIRSIEYSAEEGFLLNGEEILMKGACLHHDNGLLGAAAFKDAEYRRVRIMKENGYNAIRTSHNPPSADFLDACDELGVLVIDEAFDHWVKPKRPNDYSNYFEEWHKKDVQAMVYRDRNHPSVIMWSFGNEVQERADPEGIEIGRKLIAAIREVDDSRPITQAICDFWDNPGKEWDYAAGAFEILDIGGYNYKYDKYESDHQLYPERIMYGSETFPMFAWENWELVKKLPYVVGDFVWTGMDYLGESGIGNVRYVNDVHGNYPFHREWPWYISWCGDIDILGNKKPQSYYRDVVWGESKLEMMVSAPVPEGKTARISHWGWYDELNSWSWEVEEGKKMKVKVYSSYPEVQLELNGQLIGAKKIAPEDRYIAQFEVPYQPGELKAIGKGEDKTETISLFTAKGSAQLKLLPEREVFSAHKNSVIFIPVEAVDEEGVSAIQIESELKVVLSGEGELLAAGNANPAHDGSFTDGVFKLFRGRGMIIVRSNGVPGEIVLEVSSKNMAAARVVLQAN